MGIRTKSRRLELESLEDRLTPATLIGSTKFTYQDVDGDNVTVTFSKPILNLGNIDALFGAGFVNGSNTTPQQLTIIDLTSVGAPASGTSITLTAVRSPVSGGDGLAAVGQLLATGIDLGAVSIDGDLAKIVAGDATTGTSGLKRLTAQSLGVHGLLNQRRIADADPGQARF